MSDTNAKDLLEKYWAAETSLAEEERLKKYYQEGLLEDKTENLLFEYFEQERAQKSSRPITIERKSNLFKITRRRLMSIAAAALILASALFVLPSTENHKVIDDPDKALEVTMTALGFLNGSIDKSEVAVKEGLSQFDKTRLFTFYNTKQI